MGQFPGPGLGNRISILWHGATLLFLSQTVAYAFLFQKDFKENTSDVLTKNVTRELFEKHSLKMVEDVPPEYLAQKIDEANKTYGWTMQG